jgi:hypothetical protein
MTRLSTWIFVIQLVVCVVSATAQNPTDQSNVIVCAGGGSTCKTGFVPKFSSNGGGAKVNDSAIFETSKGNVGIGTTSPNGHAKVEGFSSSTSGIGLYGVVGGGSQFVGLPTGTSVVGNSSSGSAVAGISDAGQALTGVSYDYYLAGVPTLYLNNTSVEAGTVLYATGGQFGGVCTIDGLGDLQCTGSKSAVVPVDNGTRKVALYAVEAPQNWFEDAGTGMLYGGSAVITLEPTFAQTVNTGADYHVFLTPNGECKGLYVTQKTEQSFVVRELGGGTSNIAFDFRIMAQRKGYENIRLADKTKEFQKPPSQFGWTHQ